MAINPTNATKDLASDSECKMLAMGRALMLEPALVVLDEPTANLAPIIGAKAVLEISDRTYVLGGGQLRMVGTPSELSASGEFVESFLGGTRTG